MYILKLPAVAPACAECGRPIDAHLNSPTAPWSVPVIAEGRTVCTYCHESRDGEDVAQRSIPRTSREALARWLAK